MRERDLPLSLFDDLLSAFAQDTTTHSLRFVGRSCSTTAGDRRIRSAVSCSASPAIATRRSSVHRTRCAPRLQLTNFWQDFGRDWRAGRLYVPREIYEATGASLDDLRAGRFTANWVDALTRCVARTRDCVRRRAAPSATRCAAGSGSNCA